MRKPSSMHALDDFHVLRKISAKNYIIISKKRNAYQISVETYVAYWDCFIRVIRKGSNRKNI